MWICFGISRMVGVLRKTNLLWERFAYFLELHITFNKHFLKLLALSKWEQMTFPGFEDSIKSIENCWVSKKNFFSDHTDFSVSLILASYRCDNSGWLNRTQVQWINKLLYSCILGEQGWYSGENTLLSTKLLPVCGPGLNSSPVPYVGWGFCWFSPAPRVFLRILPFFSLYKNQHLQIPIQAGLYKTWDGSRKSLEGSVETPKLNKIRHNASVNSSSAHAPRANPRALAFFWKNGQIPGGGDTWAV